MPLAVAAAMVAREERAAIRRVGQRRVGPLTMSLPDRFCREAVAVVAATDHPERVGRVVMVALRYMSMFKVREPRR